MRVIATNGRPPKPREQHRKAGTLRPSRHGTVEPSNVVSLAPARGVPEPPVEFGPDGMRLWERAWQEAVVWLAPVTDTDQVVEACRLADDITIARARYRATREPADARALGTISKLLQDALSSLGFNPTARTRLGVAEVKRMSALEELAAKRGTR